MFLSSYRNSVLNQSACAFALGYFLIFYIKSKNILLELQAPSYGFLLSRLIFYVLTKVEWFSLCSFQGQRGEGMGVGTEPLEL